MIFVVNTIESLLSIDTFVSDRNIPIISCYDYTKRGTDVYYNIIKDVWML